VQSLSRWFERLAQLTKNVFRRVKRWSGTAGSTDAEDEQRENATLPELA
jgi:hypothetical protein